MHILSPGTDNCPSWISGRERMTVENISWSISTRECCRPRRGLNPQPSGLQSDGASNWATEAGLEGLYFVTVAFPGYLYLHCLHMEHLRLGKVFSSHCYSENVTWTSLHIINNTRINESKWRCGTIFRQKKTNWKESKLTHFSRETRKRVTGKRCRPRSDAAERGVWSGSSLFANSLAIFL